MKPTLKIPTVLFGLCAVVLAMPQTVTLKPLASGAMKKIGFYYPQRVALSDQKPSSIKKLPEGLQAPSFGELTIQGKSVGVVLDRRSDGAAKLFVDTNGNGDLTDDAPVAWTDKTYPSRDGTKTWHQHMGTGAVEISLAGKRVPASLGFYIFDPADTDRPSEIAHALFYYADYASEGKIDLGGKSYDVILDDAKASGTFLPAKSDGKAPSGVYLLIDRTGAGTFKLPGEAYDVAKPFNIGGTTYELSDIAKDGSSLKVGKSSQTVAEITLPLRAGQKALSFNATDTEGKAVQFPADYKGKIVLLDFWATWCGPCMGEVPNVVATYNKYHSQGFEILGISLDNAQTAKDVAKVTKDKGMSWTQVCDAKFWEAAVAKLYNIQSIPHAYLIDGDTGQIIAEGDDIRGDGLAKALIPALKKPSR